MELIDIPTEEGNEVSTRYRNHNDMAHGFVTFREVDRAREAIRDIGGDLVELLTGT